MNLSISNVDYHHHPFRGVRAESTRYSERPLPVGTFLGEHPTQLPRLIITFQSLLATVYLTALPFFPKLSPSLPSRRPPIQLCSEHLTHTLRFRGRSGGDGSQYRSPGADSYLERPRALAAGGHRFIDAFSRSFLSLFIISEFPPSCSSHRPVCSKRAAIFGRRQTVLSSSPTSKKKKESSRSNIKERRLRRRRRRNCSHRRHHHSPPSKRDGHNNHDQHHLRRFGGTVTG